MSDVVVIGAGMSGLVCAQQLSQAGYSVLVVDKSRGVGGRLATRRLYGTIADHGACYLKPNEEIFARLVNLLHNRHILEIWPDNVGDFPRYAAPGGMNTIGKFLAQGLDILLNQRVTAINPTLENQWRLTLESSDKEIKAKSVVVAIPAPQALMLLEPLGENLLTLEFLNNLSSVEFSPCLSVIAGYPSQSQPLPGWKAWNFIDDALLAWIGWDSSKRPNPQQPHFVVQSSADFAQIHDQTQDLHPVGQLMLQHAAQSLSLTWLEAPEWMQVHRWRYAFPKSPWQKGFLSAETTPPLVCCGDWCGGNLAESAMLSGLAAAEKVNNDLQQLLLPELIFENFSSL
jgi:renalase